MPGFREQLLRPSIEIFVLVSVRLYRDGIADALQQDRRFRVVGSAASLDSAREALDTYTQAPDLALVDVDLAEGADAARTLRSALARDVDRRARGARERRGRRLVGGGGCLRARLARRVACRVARRSRGGGQGRGARLAAGRCGADPARRLGRGRAHGGERDAAHALRARDRAPDRRGALEQGDRASSLQIELATVKNHVHNILEKLRVSSRTAAVAAARARGELDRV